MSEVIFTDGTELAALHSSPPATVQGSTTVVANAQIIRPRRQQIMISVNSEISRTLRNVGQTQRLLISKVFAGSSQRQSSKVFQYTTVCVQVWLPDCYLLRHGCFAPRWQMRGRGHGQLRKLPVFQKRMFGALTKGKGGSIASDEVDSCNSARSSDCTEYD
jgi:hypothetical protein